MASARQAHLEPERGRPDRLEDAAADCRAEGGVWGFGPCCRGKKRCRLPIKGEPPASTDHRTVPRARRAKANISGTNPLATGVEPTAASPAHGEYCNKM